MKIKTINKKELSPQVYAIVLFDTRNQPRFLHIGINYRLEEAILEARIQAKEELGDQEIPIESWDSKLFTAVDLMELSNDADISYEVDYDKNEIIKYAIKNFTKEDIKLINSRIK